VERAGASQAGVRVRAILEGAQTAALPGVGGVGVINWTALDALTERLDARHRVSIQVGRGTTPVIVQPNQSDPFFSAEQQRRLEDLMTRWRNARDGNGRFTLQEQAELDSLAETELRAARERALAMINGLAP
jgi:hypothetical protein